jgi:hypothetical protein
MYIRARECDVSDSGGCLYCQVSESCPKLEICCLSVEHWPACGIGNVTLYSHQGQHQFHLAGHAQLHVGPYFISAEGDGNIQVKLLTKVHIEEWTLYKENESNQR